jgi:hypothetical protein
MLTGMNTGQNRQPVMASSLGVALLFNDEFVGQFLQLQRRACTLVSLSPTLSRETNLPHITLLQGQFSAKADLPAWLHQTRTHIEQRGGLVVTLADFVYQSRGWLFLNVLKDPQLQGAHNSIAQLAAPMMLPPREIEEQRLKDYTAGERGNYVRYGYRYMFDAFYPHITLGRMNGDLPDDLLPHLNAMLLESGIQKIQPISAVSLYEIGDNGAHARSVILERLK